MPFTIIFIFPLHWYHLPLHSAQKKRLLLCRIADPQYCHVWLFLSAYRCRILMHWLLLQNTPHYWCSTSSTIPSVNVYIYTLCPFLSHRLTFSSLICRCSSCNSDSNWYWKHSLQMCLFPLNSVIFSTWNVPWRPKCQRFHPQLGAIGSLGEI